VPRQPGLGRLTAQRHLGASSRTRVRCGRRSSTCGQAAGAALGEPGEPRRASFGRMVGERPRTPLSGSRQRFRGRSCVESSPVLCGRRSWMALGNGRDLFAPISFARVACDGCLTSSGGVETSRLSNESLVLDCNGRQHTKPPLILGSRFVVKDSRGTILLFARKKSPEMLSASHRTTTTFWPFNSCLATMLARRPRRWPLPSMMT
jgi:hypothetical protein